MSELISETKKQTRKTPKEIIPLLPFYNESNLYEIGIDEAGRGPLFGRLYVGAVVLPKNASFEHERMKDSKRFHSKKKINEVAQYIKENAIAWSVQYAEHDEIDRINIRQALFRCMHSCIEEIETKLKMNKKDVLLLVDGNDFKPYTKYNEETEEFETIRHETIEGGDNKYTPIAAASILAKVSRDHYIDEMCEKYPELNEKYSLSTNMGYGTKAHIQGIAEHGLSEWHRRSYKLKKL